MKNFKSLVGQTFNSIMSIEVAVEKVIGEEIVGRKETEECYTFKTETGREIQVTVDETIYEIKVTGVYEF